MNTCANLIIPMSQLSDEDFAKLSRLCRIQCSELEKTKFVQSLSKILTYVEQLKEVDTTGVNPCYSVLETVQNVMREDEVQDLLSQDEFLNNAPAHVSGLVKVPTVIKF